MFGLIEQERKEEVLVYRTPEKRHLSQFADKVSEIFARDEPISKCLNLSVEQLSQYVFRDFIEQGDVSLSAVGENVKTSEIFGGFLVSDFVNFVENPEKSNQNPENIEVKEPKNVTILKEFLGQVESEYLKKKGYPKKNEIAYSYAGFLERNYRSLGIAYKFIGDQEAYYNRLGYKKIVCIYTGKRSQQLARMHGYTLVSSVSYKDFQYEGVNVFKDIREDSCLMMEKDISQVHTRSHKIKSNIQYVLANTMFKVSKLFRKRNNRNRNGNNQQTQILQQAVA